MKISAVKWYLKEGIKKAIGYHKKQNNPVEEPFIDFFYQNPSDTSNLIIFDDFLPNLLGSWRSCEISNYLKKINGTKLICLLNFYSKDNLLEDFETDKNKFVEKFHLQNLASSIIPVSGQQINIKTRLAYCLFYNNLKSIFPILEKFQVPFLFTLFPGGGFVLYNNTCDEFLKKISKSPLLKKVLVTQQCVYDYVVDKNIFNTDQLFLNYGACYPIQEYKLKKEKQFYGKNKATLDICFVAAKYTESGLDKGFDLFCHTAFSLCKKYDFIQFHVVGNFEKADLLFDIPAEKINFYGLQYFDWFADFYFDKDIILSPVRPFILHGGAFDGFPTGAVIDAGFYEVVMISSDPLADNSLAGFENWNEIIITEPNLFSIVKSIEKLIANPQLIEMIGKSGKKKLMGVLSEERQINQRLNIINNINAGCG